MSYTRCYLRLAHLVSVVMIAAGFLTACSETRRGVEPPIEGFRTVEQGAVYAGSRPDSDGLRWLDSLGEGHSQSGARGMEGDLPRNGSGMEGRPI